MPPLSTTIELELNVYWLWLTVVSGGLCCFLSGYLAAYLLNHNRPTQYIYVPLDSLDHFEA